CSILEKRHYVPLPLRQRYTRRGFFVCQSVECFVFGGAGDFFGGGDTEHFFDRSDAEPDEPPAIIGQSAHADATGGVANGVTGSVFEDQLPDVVIAIHPFKNGVASIKTGLAAFPAADRAVNRGIGRNADLRFEGLGGGRMVLGLAL